MSGDLATVDIHGRRFQKVSIDERIYCVPNASDNDEEDRLIAQHQLLYRLLEDSIMSPRIPLNDPKKVLDLGYGGGDWCVQFAEEYEDCEVTGFDVFPMHLADEPENLKLVGYNLNDRLNDPEVFQLKAYDLVHSRFISAGLKRNRWPSYIRDIRALLRPSTGWVQLTEYHMHIMSDNGRLTPEMAVYRWWHAYVESMQAMNRDARIGARLEGLLVEAGLRNVYVDFRRLPIGGWSAGAYMPRAPQRVVLLWWTSYAHDADVALKDPNMASIGRESVEMVGDLLQALGLWPFTAQLGWTTAQFDGLIRQVRSELQDITLRLYLPM